VTWGTPVQSFVFLGLLVFELEPMYATSDRRTTDADHRLMSPPPAPYGARHNKQRQTDRDTYRHMYRTQQFNKYINTCLPLQVHFLQCVIRLHMTLCITGGNCSIRDKAHWSDHGILMQHNNYVTNL